MSLLALKKKQACLSNCPERNEDTTNNLTGPAE